MSESAKPGLTVDLAARFTVVWVLISACGCSVFNRNSAARYETLPARSAGDPERAKELNQKGLRDFQSGKLDKAERHLQDALIADVGYGPAHNNLGQLYLARHQLYLAAWEFEYAASLMPERVEPILNQGIVYELAGRMMRAQEFYDIAYAMDPANAVAIGNLARLRIKQDGDPVEIHHLLRELVFFDSRPDWVQWAEEMLATRYRDDGFVDVDAESSSDETLLAPPDGTPPTLMPLDQPTLPVPGKFHLPEPTGAPELLPLPVEDASAQAASHPPNFRVPEPGFISPALHVSPIATVSFDEVLRVERESGK